MADTTSTSNAAPAKHSQFLTATYSSPTNASFTHIQELPQPTTNDAKGRAAYLGELKRMAAAMQEQINAELTERMEEDKKREAEGQSGEAKKNGAVDEDKEEENYGEEVVEED